ncbi:MAG: SurA N-terminal domain-containing protein [Proteobacteria bacterium]|nr:SurA N-terminal domain-containing protein [Pseudomonadota bacterium]
MLKLMRENAGSWIIKILLGVVVLVFIFLGIGPDRTNNQDTAAVVNKKAISMDEFRNAYDNVIQRYRSQFGDTMNDEFIKMLRIKENTLESLIDRELISQEAEKNGIKVTDEEVKNLISGISYFQENGAFSPGKYSNYIKYSRQSPDLFESMQREELLIRKFQGLIFDTATVSDDETRAWFNWEKMGIRIDYVLFETSTFKDLTPTDDEIKAYYEKNVDGYRAEPKAKVKYLRFSPDEYSGSLSLSDKEIEDYFKTNEDTFSRPKTVEAKHILIKVDENAPAALVEEKRLKAQEVYDLAIKDGQDFSELARLYSEDGSKDNGGDLGAFEEGQMIQPFSDKAFSMKAGEISEPVRTQYGFHVIKVDKINEAFKPTLSDVKPEIEKSLTKGRSENMAYDNAYAIYDDIISGSTLDQAAQTSKGKVIETEWFTQAGPLNINTAIRRSFTKTAFELTENGISDLLELGGDYFIIQVTGKTGADIQPLSEVRTRVVSNLIKEMQDNKAKEEAASLIASINAGTVKFDDVKDLKETAVFTRDSKGTELGFDDNVIKESFGLSLEKNMSEKPVKGRNGYYVIRLKEKKEPDAALFDKEKERIQSELTEKKQSQAYSRWLNQLKAKSTIEKNINLSD